MFLRIILLFLLISGCNNSAGFKSEPKGTDPKKIGLEQNGVALKLECSFRHDFNTLR